MRINLFYIFIYWVLISCSNSYYVTPVQYGALPDGKTDCTESIQRMLHDMKKKKIFKAKFPAGYYLISDGFKIDFPCSITGTNATVITQDTLGCKYAFNYSLSKKGDFVPNKKKTELSLNFKIHGVPVAFHGYNKIYMHDCNVSTFTGTDIYYKNTKFWFAINCDRMYDAHFKNIHFDQPVNYRKNQFNSADGLHITGLCHNIIIDHLTGACGDDFIALNANEDTPGDIYNVIIRNCIMGDTLTKNGIRIYGTARGNDCAISNILIEKCTIRSDNSPCIYFTNSANGVFNKEASLLKVENILVRKCKLYAPKYELASGDHPSIIRIAGVKGNNIKFEKIKGFSNRDSITYFINFLDNSIINNLTLKKCSLKGKKSFSFLKNNGNKTPGNKVAIYMENCKFNGDNAMSYIYE